MCRSACGGGCGGGSVTNRRSAVWRALCVTAPRHTHTWVVSSHCASYAHQYVPRRCAVSHFRQCAECFTSCWTQASRFLRWSGATKAQTSRSIPRRCGCMTRTCATASLGELRTEHRQHIINALSCVSRNATARHDRDERNERKTDVCRGNTRIRRKRAATSALARPSSQTIGVTHRLSLATCITMSHA
jgi:hypothetical protein